MDISQFVEKYKVNTSPGPCWLWTKAKTNGGYGRAYIRKGVEMKAHRLAFTIANGPIPQGLVICHRCDVRACVNPDHLFIGTALDNIRDMIAKGRKVVRRGETHPKARFTEAQVASIRSDNRPASAVARVYGVSPNYIAAIRRGAKWASSDRPYAITKPRQKLTARQVLKIRADTRPLSAIAASYGASKAQMSRIKNGLSRAKN